MKRTILTDLNEMEQIIQNAEFCYLSMTDDDHHPYVIPMNFGYQDGVFHFHGAREGKKTRLLRTRPEVCIALSTDAVLRWQHEAVACSYSMKYRSILAYGRAEFIEDPTEKKASLALLMAHFSDRSFHFNPPSIREVCCWKVVVERMEGRMYGY